VALIELLFPLGERIAPRTRYGWRTFPLGPINRLLRPRGLTIHATRTRKAEEHIACLDDNDVVQQFGTFELRRIGEGIGHDTGD
jgi:hypothetical protein